VTFDAAGSFHFTTTLPADGSADGAHVVRLVAADAAGDVSQPTTFSFRLDTRPPGLRIDSPTPPVGTVAGNVTVRGQVADGVSGVASLTAQVDGGAPQAVPVDASGRYSFTTALPLGGSADGPHEVRLVATDRAGNTSGPVDRTFTLDTRPPSILVLSPAPGSTTNKNVTVTGAVTDNGSGVASLQGAVDSGAFAPVVTDASGAFTLSTSLPLNGSADGPHTVHLRATDRVGNVSAVSDFTFTLTTTTPGLVPPPVDPTVATTVYAATQFLYTGSDPVQKGVAPGTIEPTRAAVLRGQVRDRAGAPIPGVTITVLSHPEFGSTATRSDGMLDLAVNGGGLLTVTYAKPGYLPVQRQVDVPWQDYAWLPDVVMIAQDPAVTAIDLTSDAPIQVARGSVVTDSDGTRQATILFPRGTQADIYRSDGSRQSLDTLHVRVTEFTVGDSGPEAMPGLLPPTSAYTYAVQLGVDEATKGGVKIAGKDVLFNQPVSYYVENFLGFPVGGIVPSGYYDNDRATWVADENGRVIQVLSITGGSAALDVNGDGKADGATALAALGITAEEKRSLATLYQPGQSLWRVPLTHFSTWDLNWPGAKEKSAEAPKLPPPELVSIPAQQNQLCGSVIGAQGQTLGEAVDVVGTPFTLGYSSDRTPGRRDLYALEIPLSGERVPDSLLGITLEVYIAGRRFTRDFAPATNLKTTFTWDGTDGYGRTLQGAQPVFVRVGYRYEAVYGVPAATERAFAIVSGVLANLGIDRGNKEIIFWQPWKSELGGWDARAQELGGWGLDVQNTYDPVARILYLGDGEQRSAAALQSEVLSTAAGAPKTNNGGYGGDGGPATQAKLNQPTQVAVGPDGSLYIADSRNNRIRRIGPDGIITTVAGNGTADYRGDGGPATKAQLNGPSDVAVGPDGSLYIADWGNRVVRRVGPDGVITTVAGDGSGWTGGDGKKATEAQIGRPNAIAIGPDGSLYIAGNDGFFVRRVGPDGFISTIAGRVIAGNIRGYSGDGGPAALAQLNAVGGLAWPTRAIIVSAASGRTASSPPSRAAAPCSPRAMVATPATAARPLRPGSASPPTSRSARTAAFTSRIPGLDPGTPTSISGGSGRTGSSPPSRAAAT
jgi:hypothetical protein